MRIKGTLVFKVNNEPVKIMTIKAFAKKCERSYMDINQAATGGQLNWDSLCSSGDDKGLKVILWDDTAKAYLKLCQAKDAVPQRKRLDAL